MVVTENENNYFVWFQNTGARSVPVLWNQKMIVFNNWNQSFLGLKNIRSFLLVGGMDFVVTPRPLGRKYTYIWVSVQWPKPKTDASAGLRYTGLVGELEHLKIETRLIDETFECVMTPTDGWLCDLEGIGVPSIFRIVTRVFIFSGIKKGEGQGKESVTLNYDEYKSQWKTKIKHSACAD